MKSKTPPQREAPAEAHAPDPILDQEPIQIGERGAHVGEERLSRSGLDVLVTGVIGGIEVFVGGLAAAAVIGSMLSLGHVDLYTALMVSALVFPAGFLFVVLGRSELFTENFLIPVVAVATGRAPVHRLLATWGLSWVGNMLGCAAMAALANVPHTFGDPITRGFTAYSAYKLSVPPLGTFASAIFAGAVMTLLTWLLLAVRSSVVKAIVIWAAGYALFATNLSHVVVGSALIFTGFTHTGYGWLDVAAWLGITTAGNLAGGVGLITLFRGVQVWEKRRQG